MKVPHTAYDGVEVLQLQASELMLWVTSMWFAMASVIVGRMLALLTCTRQSLLLIWTSE